MAKSTSTPWIKDHVLKLLAHPHETNNRRNGKGFAFSNKTVQVMSCSAPTQSILVSDKENYISVFLTKKVFAQLAEEQLSLPELKYCLITLKAYHFSTTVTAGAGQDFEAVTRQCSVPFAMICDKMSLLGGFDLAIMGDPRDINKEARVRAELESLTYLELAKCLSSKQFPKEAGLPDMGTYKL
jgi:hypothetical protein